VTQLLEAACSKALRPMAQMGVYLGAQAMLRTGAGGLICNVFKHLAASVVGSVTCQTVPLGLNNCAACELDEDCDARNSSLGHWGHFLKGAMELGGGRSPTASPSDGAVRCSTR